MQLAPLMIFSTISVIFDMVLSSYESRHGLPLMPARDALRSELFCACYDSPPSPSRYAVVITSREMGPRGAGERRQAQNQA